MTDSFLPEHVDRDLNAQRAKMIARLLNDIEDFDGTVAIVGGVIEIEPVINEKSPVKILIGFDKNTGKYETA